MEMNGTEKVNNVAEANVNNSSPRESSLQASAEIIQESQPDDEWIPVREILKVKVNPIQRERANMGLKTMAAVGLLNKRFNEKTNSIEYRISGAGKRLGLSWRTMIRDKVEMEINKPTQPPTQ